MCIKTAIRASALCMIPAVVGFAAGTLSVQAPRVFLALLVLSLAAALLVALRSYGRPSTGRNSEGADVDVAAGVLLALSFQSAFAVALCHQAGAGVIRGGVIVAVGTALLAAFCLTFVRRLVCGQVPWVERFVHRFVPELDAHRQVRA